VIYTDASRRADCPCPHGALGGSFGTTPKDRPLSGKAATAYHGSRRRSRGHAAVKAPFCGSAGSVSWAGSRLALGQRNAILTPHQPLALNTDPSTTSVARTLHLAPTHKKITPTNRPDPVTAHWQLLNKVYTSHQTACCVARPSDLPQTATFP
jgi:hypothetical protein